MEIKIETDMTDGDILAVYFTLRNAKVHRTVEVAAGECYVDLDRRGQPVGVEMLAPGHLQIHAKRVAKEYGLPIMQKAVTKMGRALAAV